MLALFQTSDSDPLDEDATFRGGFWSVYGGIEVTADVIFGDWVSENTSLAQAETEYWQNKWEIRKPPNYTSDKYVYSITNLQGEFVAGAVTVTGVGFTGVGLVIEAPLITAGSIGATFVGGGYTIGDWLGFNSLSATQRITVISYTPYDSLWDWHHDTFFHSFAGYY